MIIFALEEKTSLTGLYLNSNLAFQITVYQKKKSKSFNYVKY
jgi:hypothetical protein